jgi:hypothetical protein
MEDGHLQKLVNHVEDFVNNYTSEALSVIGLLYNQRATG